MGKNSRVYAYFLILTVCLLLGAAGGCWMAAPALQSDGLVCANWAARLFQTNLQYAVISVLQSAAFVLAIWFCSHLRKGILLVCAVVCLRGALFGYCFSAALFYGYERVCIYAALQNVLVLGLSYLILTSASSTVCNPRLQP